jgi:hypothetical protein
MSDFHRVLTGGVPPPVRVTIYQIGVGRPILPSDTHEVRPPGGFVAFRTDSNRFGR